MSTSIKSAKTLPRGLRAHNPGNLRRTGDSQWQGMAPVQSDPEFVVFGEARWGIRALATVLKTYQKRHRLNTVAKIVRRWAPPSENDTDAYTRAVSAQVGVRADEPIDVLQWETMRRLVIAITIHENGFCPYSAETIAAGLVAAGLEMPQPVSPKPLQATNVAAIGGTVAAVATVVIQTMDVLKDASEHARSLGGEALGPALATVALVAVVTLSLIAVRRGKILGA